MITARADLLAATTCPSSTHCLTTELESDAPANKWLKASSASAPSLNHRQSARARLLLERERPGQFGCRSIESPWPVTFARADSSLTAVLDGRNTHAFAKCGGEVALAGKAYCCADLGDGQGGGQ